MGHQLDDAQLAAIGAVRARARADRDAALDRLTTRSPADAAVLADELLARSRLTLNFHPDRRDRHGRSVADGLLDDGCYRPQFETGISNGGRFAVPGGRRTLWERRMFDGAYDGVDAVRPVYGALDVTGDAFGGSPRFGSSYVVLHEHCKQRATFTVGDSHLDPRDAGVADEMLSVLAGVLAAPPPGRSAEDLIDRNTAPTGTHAPSRELDWYVEAQVHGRVSLMDDVEEVVADPSFLGTAVGASLEHVARRHDVRLRWHGGSAVRPDTIPADFRGPTVVELARRIAGESGLVDAAAIGRSLAGRPYTPPSLEGDDELGPLQQHKKLWHCVLRFGSDAGR
ncbi:MAG: DUF3626 domain-containing protein [Ilumatobacter sp.]|uniref:DUF3626 domain-containing protein n=1 Tax=Ilumatobacter sp. TaxID=1967498 RepID=UPI0026169B98|nr:DUF3626 domain-containing protein [Ilumatobacter sp.]MDJ0768730.1 DUF3626 domain-containing protein [Ilumatobacter sp.]